MQTHSPSAKARILGLSFIALATSSVVARAEGVYQDPKAPLDARVDDLFGKLTQEEKLTLLTGTGFATAAIPRLGVPEMRFADAGQGVRGGQDGTHGPATAFPSGVSMASTWDPDLIARVGKAIGVEARNKGIGVQVMLGPAVNIQRSPLGGRNGEYFSEDPFLSSRLTVAYINGMQSVGVAACVKHYACNNQETSRFEVDVVVGERALREIYLPSFEAAVKEAHVWTVMSSYNQVNGHHASANHYLLTDVLKKGWGFDGMVMSDWGGVHETAAVVSAGNDVEMPGGDFLTIRRLEAALKNGELSQEAVDQNVRRILKTIFRVGLLDDPSPKPDASRVDSAEHRALTLEGALKGIVLLKNDSAVLPLDTSKIKSIAIIGKSAKEPQINAHGSPQVEPFHSVSPLEGIRKRASSDIKVTYVPGGQTGPIVPADVMSPAGGMQGKGWKAEYFTDLDMQGAALLVRVDPEIQFDWNRDHPPAPINAGKFAVRWTGTVVAPVTGKYELAFSGDDGYRVFVDDRAVIDSWKDGRLSTTTGEVDWVAGKSYRVRAEYYQAGGETEARFNWTLPGVEQFGDAVAAARAADVAVVFVDTNRTEEEGSDRQTIALLHEQDALIAAVAAANKNTVVVINNGTPVQMTQWIDQVPAVLESWFPGQEGGTALASILFGDANPSGKLPTTLARQRTDYPDAADFPGKFMHVKYDEGVYVGYRYFDKNKIEPQFPFGHGLSYTTFEYSKPKLSIVELSPTGTATISIDVKNTGPRDGAEVVQLYAHDTQSKIDRPVRELKGFQRVELKAGETKTVTLPITPRLFAWCDVAGKCWRADAGDYELQIGSSSRDIRAQTTVRLTGNFAEPIPFLAEQADAFPAPGDVAAYQLTTSSADENRLYSAALATDGNNSTRWSSRFADGEWLAVDLGKAVTIDHARLRWETAYASGYKIQVSDDGKEWKDVYEKADGKGGVETANFDAVTTKHVRILCVKRVTDSGSSLFSFEVFAKAS